MAASEPCGMLADDADVEPGQHNAVGFDVQDGGRVAQQEGDPARPVVDPRGVDDVGRGETEASAQDRDVSIVDRSVAQQRRSGEGEPSSAAGFAPDTDQPGCALLHQGVAVSGSLGRVEPGPRRPEGGMPGERQLPVGCEIRSR